MKITDEAKAFLTEAFISNDCDCLQITLQQSCCGSSLNLGLAKLEVGEEPVSINGIAVMMDKEAEARTENVTLAAEDGEFVIEDDSPSCCC